MDNENKITLSSFLLGISFILCFFYGFCTVWHKINMLNALSVYGNVFHSIATCDSSCAHVMDVEQAYASNDFKMFMIFLALTIIFGLMINLADNNSK